MTFLTVPAALAARRRRRWPGRASAACWLAAALAWVAIVAVMAQAGYAGNPRYLVAAASLGCVLAGVGGGAVPAVLPAGRGWPSRSWWPSRS